MNMQIEAKRSFTTKFNKNGGSLIITIPHGLVVEFELRSNDWGEFAFIKKIESARGKFKAK